MNVRKWNYGQYASGNYGAHTQAVQIGTLTLYFSYNTVIAFKDRFFPLVVSENVWSVTTGKHLNWIDSDKENRVPNSEFEDKLSEVLRLHKLEV